MRLRNKLFAACVCLFVLPATLAAQQQTPPDLEVSDARFTYDVNARFHPSSVSSRKNAAAATTVTDSPVQSVSALFRNAGAKPIKSISWEFIVFKDGEMDEIVKVHSIRSNRTILPSESVRLQKEGYHLKRSPYQTARVTRIEYADGTVWQGAKTK